MAGKHMLAVGTVLLPLLAAGWTAAWSRTWKPDLTGLARDYSMISDTRNPKDSRMIFWLTPPMVPDGPARRLLETYVILGVVRAHFTTAGKSVFDPIDTLQPLDGSGKPLKLLSGDEIPPVVNGQVATVTSIFSQSLGAFGKGFHWFVFEAGAVKACGEGGLSVPLADEVYTYKTPIPGCPNGSPA